MNVVTFISKMLNLHLQTSSDESTWPHHHAFFSSDVAFIFRSHERIFVCIPNIFVEPFVDKSRSTFVNPSVVHSFTSRLYIV